MFSFLIFLLISLILPTGFNCQGSVANFPVSDCNVSKQCVGSPDTGCLRSGICRELLKYSYDPAIPDKVKIELVGIPPMPGASNFWIAMGLNHNSKVMAGTLVSECVYSDNGVSVFTSYNSDGYVNRRLPQGQENYGISGASGTYSNGILNCTFWLDVTRNVQGSGFNLNTPLYLVLGDGPAQGNVIDPHQTTPWTSDETYTLAAANQQQGVYSNLQSLNTLAPVRTSMMTLSRMTSAPITIDQCGTSKGCLANPPNCLSTGNCQTIVSYQVNPDWSGEIIFELWRTMTSSGDQYVAMGLNPISPSMSETAVVACVSHTNIIEVVQSYNPGYYSMPTDNSNEGITVLQTAADGSHLYCQFSLQKKKSFRGNFQNSPVLLNINDPAYLMLAFGPAKPNGQVSKHSQLPLLSTDKVSFATIAAATTANSFISNPQAPQSPQAAMTSSRMTSVPMTIDQCGSKKGCLTNPPNCLSTGNCQTIVSYQVNPDRSGEILFELWRTMTSSGDQYVAMGLNPASPTMAGTGVVACVSHANAIDVLSSYNPGYSSMPTDNSNEGLTVLQTGADGSHLYCQFSLQTKKSFHGSFPNSPVEVDLNNPAYLMLAYGSAQSNGLLMQHDALPITSVAKTSLATASLAAAANHDMYKAHGGLMVVAWMFLASIGIFTARYYKKMWLNHKPCGLALWFHIHRPIMLLAVSCAIAAFVIIFVFKAGQWTQTPPSKNPHPIIGIIAFILGLIQPIMAVFRPHPGTANRPIFNWAHFLVGFSAHIMAIAAIFLGLIMPQMTINGASTWIMVAFSSFHALWLILLQLIDWIAPRVKETRKTTMQMKTINGNGVVFEETVVQAPEESPASKLKTIMWFTHFIVVGALTIAILILIGIST